jgi:peptide/nickel transport system ATP-binding protein
LIGAREHAGAVEVRDLEVRFASQRLFGRSEGEVRAVDGVSFEVEPGEVFCIAGESGCGKTTLGRALLGLVRQSSGSVSISGLDPAHLKGEELRKFRRQAQVVFQDPMGSLNPRQSVYEAIAEGAEVAGPTRSPALSVCHRAWSRPAGPASRPASSVGRRRRMG